jgi:hypothetical protein
MSMEAFELGIWVAAVVVWCGVMAVWFYQNWRHP